MNHQSAQNPIDVQRTLVELNNYRMALDHKLNADPSGYGYFLHDASRIKFAEQQPSGKPARIVAVVGLVGAFII